MDAFKANSRTIERRRGFGASDVRTSPIIGLTVGKPLLSVFDIAQRINVLETLYRCLEIRDSSTYEAKEIGKNDFFC